MDEMEPVRFTVSSHFNTRLKHSIAEMHELAIARGGACLSHAYGNLRQKLEWQCQQGHSWKANAGNVLRGSWCPYCARRVRATIEEMQQIALSRGGMCLSDVYENQRTVLQWRCAEGHLWIAPASAITAGKWCARCASVAKYTIGDMRRIAIEKGGDCQSTTYTGIDFQMFWVCREGHTWQTSAASVVGGSWCPLCAHNQRLELAEMQRIAALKRGQCLSTSYVNNHSRLLWECHRKHRWWAAPQNVRKGANKQGTWCPTCAEESRRFNERLTLEAIQEVAIARGGLCLSVEYLGAKSKLTWQCSLGHVWQAFITPVRRGSWCPICAGNRKLSIELFHDLAEAKGGRCLSVEYLNKEAPLLFQCAVGHTWKTRAASVRSGSWCKVCVHASRRNRYKRERTDDRRV